MDNTYNKIADLVLEDHRNTMYDTITKNTKVRISNTVMRDVWDNIYDNVNSNVSNKLNKGLYK